LIILLLAAKEYEQHPEQHYPESNSFF